MVMWGETGVASNKNTEATVSETEEGKDVLRFAQAYNMGLVNTFIQKQEEHLITYNSGNRRTAIDYILVKITDLKAAKYGKEIPGESITMQHRI